MNVQNLTTNYYYLGRASLRLDPLATLVVADDIYNNDDAVAHTINRLDANNNIAVSSTPAGYPRGGTAEESLPDTQDAAEGDALVLDASLQPVWADTGGSGDLDAHLTDTIDAHDASAISIVDSDNHYTGSTVEAALDEIGDELNTKLTKVFDSILGADTASIDTGANGIPQTFDHLEVRILCRTSQAVVQSNCNVTLNNDTSSIYDRNTIRNVNTTVTGSSATAAANWALRAFGASADANAWTQICIRLNGYRQTVAHKTGDSFGASASGTAAQSESEISSLRYRSTTAISRLAIAAGSGNLLAGSRLTIYGY